MVNKTPISITAPIQFDNQVNNNYDAPFLLVIQKNGQLQFVAALEQNNSNMVVIRNGQEVYELGAIPRLTIYNRIAYLDLDYRFLDTQAVELKKEISALPHRSLPTVLGAPNTSKDPVVTQVEMTAQKKQRQPMPLVKVII